MKNRKFVFCTICNEQTKFTAESFGRWHLQVKHNISFRGYYDKYIKKEDEGKCLSCKKETKFISANRGYLKFCSTSCLSNDIKVKDKIKQTKKNKYNDECFNNRAKAKNTNSEKYGVENVSQNLSVKNKKKETLKKNYGVENPLQSQVIKDKIVKTCLDKYGVINPSMFQDFKDKRTQTIYDKYGFDHYSKTPNYRELQEKLGKWIPLEFKSDFEIYRILVWHETNKWKKLLFSNWNGLCYYSNEKLSTDKSEYNNPNYATIEHKTSIFFGFKNNLSPEEMGNINNLCICSRLLNTIKGLKSEKQFIKYLKNKNK